MRDSSKMEMSIIIPMCNEEANVERTAREVARVLDELTPDWELLLVDDGSTDGTAEAASRLSQGEHRIRVLSHGANLGRGQALRTGFAAAKGRFVFTIDCDLSYSPEHIREMHAELAGAGRPDMVIASPYMKGGRAEGVPFFRLATSRLGNLLLSFALGGAVKTITGIARGYRKTTIDSLDLSSSGKEIHLEIVSKALAVGYRILEIPAVLRGRHKGKSKMKLRVTTLSHLLFSYYEKPLIFFGVAGLILILLGIIGGAWIIVMWQQGMLNPSRPLMTLVVILLLGGIQILSLGFVGSQIASMRRDIFRIQSQTKLLQRSVSDSGDKEE
jgi:glycosyltransferase involved in cell wall biosynthesis